jgi:hypothetical protein
MVNIQQTVYLTRSQISTTNHSISYLSAGRRYDDAGLQLHDREPSSSSDPEDCPRYCLRVVKPAGGSRTYQM